MLHRTLAGFVVVLALCVAGGPRVASGQVPPPSPTAKAGINQINNLAKAYENWARVVCPIFADAVEYYSDIDPQLGLYFADYYSDLVCDVADNYSLAVNNTAKVYLSLARNANDRTQINAARTAALRRIQSLKNRCVALIQAAAGPQAPVSPS